jgi:hypothetical protein
LAARSAHPSALVREHVEWAQSVIPAQAGSQESGRSGSPPARG